MFKQWFLVICVISPLWGCMHFRHATPKDVHQHLELYKLSDFNRVIATGNINLHLHTDARRPWITVHGDPRDTAAVTWSVKDHIMRIDLGKGYPKYGAVDIELGSRHLVSLMYHGEGQIMGKKLHSKQLDVTIINSKQTVLEGQLNLRQVVLGGKGSVHLKGSNSRAMTVRLKDKVRVQIVGISNVEKLEMSDHSWLSLFWLKSSTLRVHLKDRAHAQIAGITKVEFLDLLGHSHFNGRYLRATEAFVKTHDNSEADIAVVNNQHTLASDKSNIYYYAIPTYQTNFMAFNGTVLDMKAWEAF
ncbi:MAG: hypothetical protein CK424_05915 [Legionella sp.]|nr:MAG: hypothetical protein CK424_05915 [Legionella sp.]